MLKRVLIGLLVALITGLGLSAPAFADANSDAKSTILQNINNYRAQYGVSALTENAAVENIAQTWAQSLQSSGDQVMMHNPYFGQELAPATQAGEVVSMYYDKDQVVTKWMLSNEHKPILISSAWNAIGIGYVYDPVTNYYWTVVNFAYYPPGSNAAKPAQPSAPTFTTQNTDATMSWNVPAENGSAIQGYDVELYNADGTSAGGTFTSSANTSYTFHNLIRGKSYYATVAAYNAIGIGMASPVTPTVNIQALLPTAPYNLSIYRFTSGTMQTYWWAPANLNGSNIIGYNITLYKNGLIYANVTTPQPSYQFTGLQNDGSTYSYTVAAVADTGTSPISTMSGTAILPVIPSNNPVTTPTNLPTSIPVSIPTSAPTTTPVPTTQPSTSTTTTTPPPLPVVAPTPLPQPTDASTPTQTNPITPSIPATVSQPDVKQQGDRALTVTWKTTSGDITQYVVTLRDTKTSKTITQIVDGGTAKVTFANLTAGAVYEATIDAKTSTGSIISSLTSETVSATTIKVAPKLSTITVVSRTHRQIAIKWHAADPGKGASIKNYTVTLKSKTWSHFYTVNASTHQKIVTVPKVNTNYTIVLTAYNTSNEHTSSAPKTVRSKR